MSYRVAERVGWPSGPVPQVNTTPLAVTAAMAVSATAHVAGVLRLLRGSTWVGVWTRSPVLLALK